MNSDRWRPEINGRIFALGPGSRCDNTLCSLAAPRLAGPGSDDLGDQVFFLRTDRARTAVSAFFAQPGVNAAPLRQDNSEQSG